jgi:putative nucleotidyltransferase with HDIG domain
VANDLSKLLLLTVAIALLTVGHFLVSSVTHPQHAIHVMFQGLYLLPVVGGAIWFGSRGGLAAASGVALAYSVHLLHVWPDAPVEPLSQSAMVVMFLVVGGVTGALVDQQERERQRGLEMERRAQRAAIVQGIAGLSSALGFRDDYTRRHSERVSDLALQVGRQLGLGPQRLELLRLAALVHDVGKIGVPDDVLLKPDDLTPEERLVIERHPSVAADILSTISGTGEIAAIVIAHHECPDGSGYPRGLRAEEISPEAAVLRVADVFCALTDTRTYKRAMDAQAALTWMVSLTGSKVDARSVEALQRVLGRQAFLEREI